MTTRELARRPRAGPTTPHPFADKPPKPAPKPSHHLNTPFQHTFPPSVPSPLPGTLQKRENPCKHCLGTFGRLKSLRAGGGKSTGKAPQVPALPRPQPLSAPDRPSPASRCLVSGFVSIRVHSWLNSGGPVSGFASVAPCSG